jgi:hypothetical protein
LISTSTSEEWKDWLRELYFKNQFSDQAYHHNPLIGITRDISAINGALITVLCSCTTFSVSDEVNGISEPGDLKFDRLTTYS